MLDANNGYNWNPASVGVTATIGVLALIFAMLTVFQAALAAGPGRLKAGREAIGIWAKYTVTKMHWTEFRFRTTAYVPLLRRWELVTFAGLSMQGGQLGTTEPATAPLRVISAGGWCDLLNELGLQNLPFKRLECKTDYLPPDIQAAPTSADIGCIVLLAALAGCDKITSGPDGYPQAIGPGSQLTFRSHPQLGPVAVYERLPVDHPTYMIHYSQFLIQSIVAALGMFTFGATTPICIYPGQELELESHCGVILQTLRIHSGDCGHSKCPKSIADGILPNELCLLLLTADVPLSLRVFPTELLKVKQKLKLILTAVGVEDEVDGETLIQNIQQVIRTFGGEVFEIHKKDFTELPMASDRREIKDWGGRYTVEQFSLFQGVDSWAADDRDPGQPRGSRPNWRLGSTLTETDMVILTHPLTISLRWPWDEGADIVADTERATLFSGVVFQLQELDWWLANNARRHTSSCETTWIYDTLCNMKEPRESESEYGAVEARLRWILAYRAALTAMYLGLAADYSNVCETQIGERIVRFL